jgi:naphthoate synthase
MNEILGKSPMAIKMLKFAMNLTDDGMVGAASDICWRATPLPYMMKRLKKVEKCILGKT